MEKYEYDIAKTIELIEDADKLKHSSLFFSNSDGYAEIYAKSNENLKDLFSNFNIKDKNVLSVLSSSDQVFSAYYLGAKSVDTFDLNGLTEYYYYLRKWLMEYKQEYYPNLEYSSWIRELLELVRCTDENEENAYKYWTLYSNKTVNMTGTGIFKFSGNNYPTVVDNVLLMSELLRKKALHFTQENLSEKIDKRKKYDTIIISNILEYFTFDIQRLVRTRDNLFDILEDDGQIIASHLMDYSVAPSEISVFSEKFDFHDFPMTNEEFLPSGYCYSKKKC